MKNFSYLFLFIFLAFLATPTIVTFINKDANVSMAFTASEEENSSKTTPGFEYNIQDPQPSYTSAHLLQEQTAFNHYYKEGYRLIFLDVLSPPPKQA